MMAKNDIEIHSDWQLTLIIAWPSEQKSNYGL